MSNKYRKDTIRDRIRNNQMLSCKVAGCNRNRRRLLCYCGSHSYRWLRFGHPEAEAIPRQLYTDDEYVRCLRVINLNRYEHHGVETAVKRLSLDINQAYRDGVTTGYRVHLAKYAGSPPEMVLALATSGHLMAEEAPRKVKPFLSDQHQRFQVAWCVIKGLKGNHLNDRTERNEYVRDLSTYLNDTYGLLMINIATTIVRKAKQEERYMDSCEFDDMATTLKEVIL